MSEDTDMGEVPAGPLRRGWTTGACATAATRAALEALLSGTVPGTSEIALPSGQRVMFAIASGEVGEDAARAAVVKDAGDDPDVTHGALVIASVRRGAPGTGVKFRAGAGVGTVTKPGLPIPPGEPAINPVPRQMMCAAVAEVQQASGFPGDVEIEISVAGGEALAARTLNPRLGILGGLSILGTTGVVVPYSCAAWIHSIYRGIDVARALGITHVAGSTGATSEAAVQKLYALPESALIDMGDFVGGMLKYLRQHPVPRVTIAGGFAKMVKLGQGLLDLHSKRGELDLAWLGEHLSRNGAPADLAALAGTANSALEMLQVAQERNFAIGPLVAEAAWRTARGVLVDAGVTLDVVVFDREGRVVGQYGRPD